MSQLSVDTARHVISDIKAYHADKKADHYLCPEGKIIPLKKVFLDYRTKTKKKEY